MPIPDDTTYGAQRGDVSYDQGTQAFYTRATGAWRIQQPTFVRTISPNYPGSNTTLAAIRGQVYLQPFYVPQRMTLNKIFLLSNTNSGTVRFAVYADVSDSPNTGTKLVDS